MHACEVFLNHIMRTVMVVVGSKLGNQTWARNSSKINHYRWMDGNQVVFTLVMRRTVFNIMNFYCASIKYGLSKCWFALLPNI